MKQWKRWIREDLKGLGLFLVLAGGLLYAILFWFGYHLTYDNTILPGGNFWLVGGEILLTGIVAAAVLAVLFRALSGGFCRTETPTVMPENKCTSTSAPTADAAEYDHEKDGQTATGNERKKEKSGIWRTRYASFIEKKYAFFVLWAVIFLLWIPFWLSSYPGIFPMIAICSSTGISRITGRRIIRWYIHGCWAVWWIWGTRCLAPIRPGRCCTP